MKNHFVKYYRTIVRLFFSLGLFLLPFIFWPTSAVPYEIPRVWFFERWIEIIGLVGCFGIPWVASSRSIRMKPVIFVFVFFTVATIASLVGSDLPKSIWGNYYRSDGLFTLFHLGALIFFLTLYWEDSWKQSVTKAIALGSIGVSIWTCIEGIYALVFGLHSVTGFGAVGATFGQPQFLAGYLAITLPFTYFCFTSNELRWRRLWQIGFVLQVSALGITRSIGGLLTFVVFCICISVFKKQGVTKRFIQIFIIAFFICIAGVVGLLVSQKTTYVAESRERIFHKVLLGVASRPLLGWGWANVDHAFESSVWPIPYQHDVYVDKAHTELLEVLATTGMSGLILYIGLLLTVGIYLYHQAKSESEEAWWHKTLFITFLLLFFHMQTNVVGIAEHIIFWFLVGLTTVFVSSDRMHCNGCRTESSI